MLRDVLLDVLREDLKTRYCRGTAGEGVHYLLSNKLIRLNGCIITNGGIRLKSGDIIHVNLKNLNYVQNNEDNACDESKPRRMHHDIVDSNRDYDQIKIDKFKKSAMYSYYYNKGINLDNLFLQPLPVTVRVNEYHHLANDVETLLKTGYYNVTRINFEGIKMSHEKVPVAYAVGNKKWSSLLNDPVSILQEAGVITVQELSSMLPVMFLNIQSTDNILDLCAAPGSKSTQILTELDSEEGGMLVINDVQRKRITRAHQRCSNQGSRAIGLVTTSQDGVEFTISSSLQNDCHFDKILVDAPCSGDGTIRKNPKRLIDWRPFRAKNNASIQVGLLKKAFDKLKPGGTLVYSTCSLNPIENEDVVEEIINYFKGLIILEECPVRDQRWLLHPPCRESKCWGSMSLLGRVIPNNKTKETGMYGGFFIAKFKKTCSRYEDVQDPHILKFRGYKNFQNEIDLSNVLCIGNSVIDKIIVRRIIAERNNEFIFPKDSLISNTIILNQVLVNTLTNHSITVWNDSLLNDFKSKLIENIIISYKDEVKYIIIPKLKFGKLLESCWDDIQDIEMRKDGMTIVECLGRCGRIQLYNEDVKGCTSTRIMMCDRVVDRIKWLHDTLCN